MAYTFFKALGLPTGRSLVEDDKLDAARDIITQAKARQCRAAPARRSRRRREDRSGRADAVLKVNDPAIGDRMGLDIGPETHALYAERAARCEDRRVERPDGRVRDRRVRRRHAWRRAGGRDVNGTTIIGGGDSVAAVNKAGVADRITHISTGGGASLEFLGGQNAAGGGRACRTRE